MHVENFRDRMLGNARFCCKLFTNRSCLSRSAPEFKLSNLFKLQGSKIKDAASMPGIRIALSHRRKRSAPDYQTVYASVALTRSGVNGMVPNVMPVNWFLAFHVYGVAPLESVIV